ncbi:caspase family protein [Streptomyces sp. NA04227]|uniref:caspase family protein n=1 Tax=Streptomyces sp. NA04227 TaxID=2742136 RepID=UPI001591A7C3|nr:caspase family protein [Streptomyces sp. NA04227]QKW08372.1 caspase family protein [Streptomyces sp. NA04227]
MAERAVDPARSRIVLVGPAHYEDDRLPDVPVIANNISDLTRVLVDERLGGFSPFHCVAVPPAAGVAQVGDVLVRAAEEAEDLLLFYYSGHGLLGPRRRELYLSLAGTRPDQLAFSALPFEAIRDACLDSAATNRVVILDSCFSGRAIETLAGADEAVLGELDVSGTYTLTSSPANRTAVVLPGERHTAFTERLLDLLCDGTPAAGQMINLGDIYRHLHGRLRAEGLPVPQRRGVNNADLLGLVRNVQAGGETEAGAGTGAGTGHADGSSSAPEDGPATPPRPPKPAATATTVATRPTPTTAPPTTAPHNATPHNTTPHNTPQSATVPPQLPSPAQDMTERLTSAEAIANTITDGWWRTRALVRVALAAADIPEPERAGRLIGQAEQAAITAGEGSTRALTTVVTAAATLDPDRAERIANTAIGADSRGHLLGALVRALVATDPDRAEAIAVTIEHDHHRWRALTRVATATAAANPDRAERIVHTVGTKQERWPMLSAVAAALAPTNPDRAEHIARSISEKYLRTQALGSVAVAIAATDPDRAEQIAYSLTDPNHRWPAQNAVAKAVAATDPDRAERLARDMIGKYSRVSAFLAADTGRAAYLATLLASLLTVMAPDGPDRSERIAHAVPHTSSRENVLAAVARAIAATDPDRAQRIADGLTDKVTREAALAAVVRAVATTDTWRAELIVNSLTGPQIRVMARADLASAVADQDPALAVSLLDQAEEIVSTARLPRRTDALIAVVTAAAELNPERAERFAYAITNKTDREAVLVALGTALAAKDPDRAEHIANTVTGQVPAVRIRSAVAAAVAVSTPDRARRIAQRIQGDARAEVLHSVVVALTDPHQVARGWYL